MKARCHASLISQVASKGAMYKVKMALRACRSRAVTHTGGGGQPPTPMLWAPFLISTSKQGVRGGFVARRERRLRRCDRTHKRASITTLCHLQHLQQHRCSALFKQPSPHSSTRPPKQIRNELPFPRLNKSPPTIPGPRPSGSPAFLFFLLLAEKLPLPG